MKRNFLLALATLLGLSLPAFAGWLHSCEPHCITPPPADCPDCGCPCDHRLHLAIGDAQKLIDKLACGECAVDRIKAAKKLGCRLHADFCTCPEVADALVRALQNDPCWIVRREAAWALAMQGARTEPVVLALYLAARLDHHYMVRDRAAEALDILTVCRRDCYTDLFARADVLIVELRKGGLYKPGCNELSVALAAMCSGSSATVIVAPPTVKPELLAPPTAPAPMPRGK
jgi:hypothetical protein